MNKVISLKKYSRILWEMEILNAETNVKSSVYARHKKTFWNMQKNMDMQFILMMSNIILLLILVIFVVSVTNTQRECVRCLNGSAVTLLAFAYFKTSKGKELINKVYHNLIK